MVKISKSLAEERLEAENIQNVLLLLDHLAQREDATVKLILGCLYDVGLTNLINQKIANRPLNRLTKAIARTPKPILVKVGLWWFQKNCPQLITNWLHYQVKFQATKPKPTIEAKAEIIDDRRNSEIKQLRSQVKLLRGALVIAIALFGGSWIWLIQTGQVQPTQIMQTQRSTLVKPTK